MVLRVSVNRSGFRRLVVAVFAAAPLWGACASQVVPSRQASFSVEPDDGVSVIFSPQVSPGTTSTLGQEMVDCVTRSIQITLPAVRAVSSDEFHRVAFPDVAAEVAPLSSESLGYLLNQSDFRDRIASLRVRYLILVGGATVQPRPWGDGGCAYGCFGLLVWKRETRVWASVFDLKQGVSVGQVETTVTGRPWFAIIGIFPLGMPSFTESWACGKLGAGVAQFLVTGKAPEP